VISKLVVLTFAICLISLDTAVADVEVDPVPWSPKIYVRGEKPAPGSGTSGTAREGVHSSAPAGPKYDSVVPCRVDPVNGNYGCPTPGEQDPEPDDGPELTPGDVLRAAREIGLPSLQVRLQPGDETLVNVPTIFYAEPQPFERSVELLGFDVDLVAEPVSYDWIHGDGTAATTTEPGRPYPAMDVTHRYADPAEDLQARVDVTYRVRFRVDDGPWTAIDQTLVASGPAAALDVKEAAPVLTTP